MNKRLIIIILSFSVLAVIFAYYVFNYLLKREGSPISIFSQEVIQKNKPEKPDLFLSFSSDKTNLKLNDIVNVSIKAKADKEIYAVDLVLLYDPKALSVENIKPGDFFKDPIIVLNKISSQSGEISYSLTSLKPSNINGALAIVSFKVINATSGTSVKLGEKTLVGIKDGKKALIDFSNDLILK